MSLIIGLDDTDSRDKGMCTTYLATIIAEKISEYSSIKDRLLIRLNPNIPFKTRGNACLCLIVDTDYTERVKNIVVDLINKYAVFEDSNPGVAFLEDDTPPQYLKNFTFETVRDVKSKDEARKVAEKNNVELKSLGKNERGIVGALAAIGAPRVFNDWTYEFIAYRDNDWNEKRKVNTESFFKADYKTYPETWDTIDYFRKDVVAIPNTNGPVVYGLRGTYSGVLNANSSIEAECDRINIFRTNQGTDYHLIKSNIKNIKNYRSYEVSGKVNKDPKTIEGGHVFFSIKDSENKLKCAAFEPTKEFRNLIKKLRKGDSIKVCGGVKNNTLNIEKIYIKDLNTKKLVNPECSCGKKMESAGKNQGYRCKKCGDKASSKDYIDIKRNIKEGWYEVPPSARRHISKPLIRFSSDEVNSLTQIPKK